MAGGACYAKDVRVALQGGRRPTYALCRRGGGEALETEAGGNVKQSKGIFGLAFP